MMGHPRRPTARAVPRAGLYRSTSNDQQHRSPWTPMLRTPALPASAPWAPGTVPSPLHVRTDHHAGKVKLVAVASADAAPRSSRKVKTPSDRLAQHLPEDHPLPNRRKEPVREQLVDGNRPGQGERLDDGREVRVQLLPVVVSKSVLPHLRRVNHVCDN